MIAPVINGIASANMNALIIQPPVVELAPEPEIITVVELPRVHSELEVTMFMREKATGRTVRMDCSAFAMNWSAMPIEITSSGDALRHYVPGLISIDLKVTGPIRQVTGGRR